MKVFRDLLLAHASQELPRRRWKMVGWKNFRCFNGWHCDNGFSFLFWGRKWDSSATKIGNADAINTQLQRWSIGVGPTAQKVHIKPLGVLRRLSPYSMERTLPHPQEPRPRSHPKLPRRSSGGGAPPLQTHSNPKSTTLKSFVFPFGPERD